MTEMEPKAPFALCHKCPFVNRSVALTTGPTDARVAVVSRSPGHYEALAGKSFSGPSGKVLDHLLQVHGTSRDDVIATNVVLCQSDGTEAGFATAQSCCEPRLMNELESVETVIACGREAAWGIIGATNIASNRGYVHKEVNPATDKIQRIIVTSNPAVVLRDDANYPELVRDFRLALDPLPEPVMPIVRAIDNLDEAKEAIEQMKQMIAAAASGGNDVILSSDIEARGPGDYKGSTGLSHRSTLACAGFSIRGERAVVFGETVVSDKTFLIEHLRELWELRGVRYLWHNGKYDVKVLRTHGINAHVDEDTMLLSWCLDERPGDPESGAGGHSLEWLLKDELGWPKYEPPSVKHFKRTGRFDYYGADDDIAAQNRARRELYQYNGFDTAGSLALFEVLKHRAQNDNVWEKPYRSLLIRLSETFTRIELEGNLHDVDRACDLLEREVWPKLRRQTQTLQQISKRNLNPNSPKQLEKLLYDDWGVTHDLMRPKIERLGKRSTDQWVREKILLGLYSCTDETYREGINQFVQILDDFKELDKQRGTYLEGLVLRRQPNGRIYTDFKIHGTESGRVSSSNPNLQNITRTKEGLPNIRATFVPDPGCVFVSADLSQAELRTIAVLSGDENLQSIYRDTSRSLHKEVAAEFYGDGFTYEQYVRAKNINFGVAYWQSAFSFAQMYNMPQDEAQRYIDFWWERFPKVWEWTKAMEKQVMEVGEIQSPFGHKRRFYVIPADESGRIHTVKQGINFLPQNIAANITLWALCDFTEWLVVNDFWDICQPRITVHDSILINVEESEAMFFGNKLKEFLEMAPQRAIGWDFPYKADVSTGPNWGSLHEIDLLEAAAA